jgi:hypothetical protein
MRLPEFTAEASLPRARGNYAGFSVGMSRRDASSITAQFDYSTLVSSYWERLAAALGSCHAPCWLDTVNLKCHCQLDAVNINGPNLSPGL